jgi:hypothetical protein
MFLPTKGWANAYSLGWDREVVDQPFFFSGTRRGAVLLRQVAFLSFATEPMGCDPLPERLPRH